MFFMFVEGLWADAAAVSSWFGRQVKNADDAVEKKTHDCY